MAATESRLTRARHWLVHTLGRLGVIFIFILIGWGIYLDAHIEKKFDGLKWALPIKVMGVSKQFSLGDKLTPQRLSSYLQQLDYRLVDEVEQAGEFSFTRNQLTIFRRSYYSPAQYSEKEEFHRQAFIKVTFKNGRIGYIEQFRGNASKQLSVLTLEPFVIERMQAANLEDRELIKHSDLPELLEETLLLVEDRDFHHHHGISPFAIFRALLRNMKAGRTVQGGSTLTQQLVKNMFLTNERSLWRKIKEAYIAILLDAQYSKNEILEAYINEVYLGQNYQRGVHGFGLASQFYFAKPLVELKPSEVALLVAIIKGPSYYDPRRHPERALQRRDMVLRMMTEYNLLSRDDYEYAIVRPLNVVDKSKVAAGRYPNYMQQVKLEIKKLLADRSKRFDGLNVYTHFNPLVQNEAQAAVTAQLTTLETRKKSKNLQAAMVVINSHTGGVSAIVGDRRARYNGFNRALNAKRNIGSLLKPAIYLTALEKSDDHYQLATLIEDKPISMKSSRGKLWQPKNYDGEFLEHVPFIDALAKSRNVPAVNLGMALGIDNVTATLNTLGAYSKIPQYPAMLLGSVAMSPLEVATWYQPIANMGTKQSINTVHSVYHNQTRLAQSVEQSTRVMDTSSSYLLNYALHEVTRTGTAKWLSTMYQQTRYAGKTGTTNDLRDSWFVGYDQSQLAVVWVGRDDYKTTGLTGSSGALRVFGAYQAERKPESLIIQKPAGIVMRYFDRSTGEHVAASCNHSRLLPAKQLTLADPISCDDVLLPEDKRGKSWWKSIFDSQF